MSDSLSLIVKIQAHKDHALPVKTALLNLLEPTLSEQGCENYQLYIDSQNPAIFFFVETWTSRAHWEAHNQSPHIVEFMQFAETAVDKVELTEVDEHFQLNEHC